MPAIYFVIDPKIIKLTDGWTEIDEYMMKFNNNSYKI